MIDYYLKMISVNYCFYQNATLLFLEKKPKCFQRNYMESACGPSLNFLKFAITRKGFYLVLRLSFIFYINLSSKIVKYSKIVTFEFFQNLSKKLNISVLLLSLFIPLFRNYFFFISIFHHLYYRYFSYFSSNLIYFKHSNSRNFIKLLFPRK